jgi:hypothetical protein
VDRVPAAALALALTVLALAPAAPAAARPAPAAALAGCSGTATASDVICGPYTDKGIVMSNGFNTYDETNCWSHPGCGYHLAAPRRTAASAAPWSVTTTEQAGNTAVRSGPQEQQQTNDWCGTGWGGCPRSADTPLSALKTLRSGYAETFPHNTGTDAQAAYDLWFSNAAHNEVMVWVDNVNRGTGGARVDAHATFAKQPWTLMNYGNEIIWALGKPGAFAQQKTGTVHLLSLLRWLQHHALPGQSATILPADARLSIVDFGWEICSTGGRAETFTVNRYWLHGAAR